MTTTRTTRTWRRVAAALALSAAAAGPLAGCGIEPTDVVEVGQPAQGAKRPGAPVEEARLYFGFPGGLEPRSRPASGQVSAEMAIPLLLQGPNEPEMAQGLYTELPKMRQEAVEVVSAEGTVTIRLPLDPTRFTVLARNQLVCTASHNGVPGNPRPEEVKVTLLGAGKTMKDLVCGTGVTVGRAVPSPVPTTP
ncbi:hypothetical protein [Streptomyces sp. NPDC049555]|uniref:hypothetical protein n=1 Tax=unclassified Streptomyces TaxID=2593676 RepID=UPI00344260EF